MAILAATTTATTATTAADEEETVSPAIVHTLDMVGTVGTAIAVDGGTLYPKVVTAVAAVEDPPPLLGVAVVL